MKKFFVAVLAMLLLLSVFGCAQQQAANPAQNSPAPEGAQQPAEATSAAETPAPTQEEDTSLSDVLAKGTLVQGMDDAFPPMGFRDENDNLVGFDVDVATEVAARMGVELVPTPIKWSQKENELNSGNIDVIWNGYTITEERKAAVEMTIAYMKNRQVMVVMADSSYQSLADLAGKKVALQAGSTAADALEGAADFKATIAGGEPIEFDDNLKALLDLEVGGCDAVLMDEIVANYHISSDMPQYRVLDESLSDEEYGIGCRKGSTALVAEIEKQLLAMAEDGTLAEISNKWFGKDITTVK